MSQLTKKIKSQIKEHSLSEYPNECCGIIVVKNERVNVIKCENISMDKKNLFEISPTDYLKASKKGRLKAYYHSHTDENSDFSGLDKSVSESHNLPIVMYSVKEDKFQEHPSI